MSTRFALFISVVAFVLAVHAVPSLGRGTDSGVAAEAAPNRTTAVSLSKPNGNADDVPVGEGKLLYANSRCDQPVPFPPGALIADDLWTEVVGSCQLERYEVMVTGMGDGTGPGFPVEGALYDGCPSDGGQTLDGTAFQVDLPDDGAHLVTVGIAGAVVVAERLWIGIRLPSGGAWYLGSQAEIGRTEDAYDSIFSPCTGSFAGTPIYAGFYARLIGSADCEVRTPAAHRQDVIGPPELVYGHSVAMTVDRAFIGAPSSLFPRASTGVVFVLGNNNGVWVEEAQLVSSDASDGGSFGHDVFAYGDRVVVAAPGSPLGATPAAYVFRRSGEAWIEESKLEPVDGFYYMDFGSSMSGEGKWLAIGSPTRGNPGRDESPGAVYLYRLDDNDTPADPSDDQWTEHAKLTASDAAPWAAFGSAVSVTRDEIIVGAARDGGAGEEAGAVHVFRRDNHGTPEDLSDDRWLEARKLTASDASAGALFGVSLAVDEPWMAIGTARGYPQPHSNVVYLFRRGETSTRGNSGYAAGDWIEHAVLSPLDASAGRTFGLSLSLEDGRLTVGANGWNYWAEITGSVHLFRQDDNGTPSDLTDDVWLETGMLLPLDVTGDDGYAYGLSTHGNRVVVGAPLKNHDCDGPDYCGSGVAYFYSLHPEELILADHALLQNCLGRSGGTIGAECEPFDLVPDGRIDLTDYYESYARLLWP